MPVNEPADVMQDPPAASGDDPDLAPGSYDDRETLFAANIEAIRRQLPQMAKQLEGYKPLSTIVQLDNGEPDVDFRGVKLYGGQGARSYARIQLDRYWANPVSAVQTPPRPDTVDPHASPFVFEYLKHIAENDITLLTMPSSPKTYFSVVFGVGLAPHLEEIYEKTRCNYLLLVEPNFEFLYQSLYEFDWAGFLKRLTDNGSKIQFVISDTPEGISKTIRTTIRSHNPVGFDHTALFTHYPNAVFENAKKLLREVDMPVMLMGLGFFEDELHMISQSYRNLMSGKQRIVHDRRDANITMPVFIIGNGPSLDQHLSFIRDHQDQAVIIGGGTAIDPLLEKGIKPDFIILLERDLTLLPLHEKTAAKFDHSEMCLVASTTIAPGIADLFGDTIYFFRPGLSSLPTFMTHQSQRLYNPDPDVTNGGLAFAQQMGFRNFYFFGVDVGAKNPSHHHSKHSIYSRGRKYKHANAFTIPVPGNFGGQVYTTSMLQWTRDSMANSIRTFGSGRSYFNCSDGAMIDGAKPLHVDSVRVPEAKMPKRDLVRGIIDGCPIYTRDDFEGAWEKAALLERIPEFCEKLIACVTQHDDLRDRKHNDKAMKLLRPTANDDALPMIFRGSVYQMLIAGDYYLARVRDEERNDELQSLYKELFEQEVNKLRDEALEVYGALEHLDPDDPKG